MPTTTSSSWTTSSRPARARCSAAWSRTTSCASSTRSTTGTASGTDCDNNGGPGGIQIDAAILALNHSFITDNWYCGNPLGTLTINGALAQKFRGTVGTHSGGTVQSGYSKDYNYNGTLRYREPPYFVNPTETAWRVVRQNEQIPAR